MKAQNRWKETYETHEPDNIVIEQLVVVEP